MNFEESTSSNQMNNNNQESSRSIRPAKPKPPSRNARSSQYKPQDNGESNRSVYLEGILSKYTNVMKGWCNRYFVVNEQSGQLEYYMPDERYPDRRKSNHVRGCLNLADVVISPSEDDSQTFTVTSEDSDIVYKLKASNTKERQKWIDKLRQVALNLENLESKTNHLNDVRESLLNTQKIQIKLVNAIENFSFLDKELLMLKSTSYSSIMSLENAFAILQGLNDLK